MRNFSPAVALVVVAASVTACGGAGRHSKPSLNDEVREGNFVFTVTALNLGVPRTGSRTAPGTFVVVNLKVKNAGATSQPVYCQDQILTDRAGKKYNNAINLDHREDRVVIPPGKEVHVKCAFDVQRGALPDSLTVRDSTYTRGATVALM